MQKHDDLALLQSLLNEEPVASLQHNHLRQHHGDLSSTVPLHTFADHKLSIEPTVDVRELVRLESAISGILAGFALTIVVLLIQQQNPQQPSQYNVSVAQAAIETFIIVLFTSLLAALMLAYVGAEITNSKRGFALLVVAGFTFGISIILTMFGVVLVVQSLSLSGLLNIAKFILTTTLALALVSATTETVHVTSLIEQKPQALFVQNKRRLLSLTTITFLLPGSACILRWLDLVPLGVVSPLFHPLLLTSTILSSMAGALVLLRTCVSPHTAIPFRWLALVVLAFSFIVAWVIVCIPL